MPNRNLIFLRSLGNEALGRILNSTAGFIADHYLFQIKSEELLALAERILRIAEIDFDRYKELLQ